MASHHQDNIKLQEAMTMELEQCVRVWDIEGLHVEDADIPKDAKVSRTFVMKAADRPYQLGVSYTVAGDKGEYMGAIAEVSAWEELQERFPHLFEMNGRLHAFA